MHDRNNYETSWSVVMLSLFIALLAAGGLFIWYGFLKSIPVTAF